MCTSFAEHVRDFGSDCDPANCVLPRLEKLLKSRMKRRNLLSAPRAYLGYGDALGWDTPGAFEDISVDCYIFAFLDRIEGLRNQLRVRPNIDGLITRNVDNFLLERQRRNDPVGYAVYGNVIGAATELLASEEVNAEGTSDGRIKGQAVLHLKLSLPRSEPAAPTVVKEVLASASGWTEVLPELTSVKFEGQEWIAAFLRQLRAEAIASVRVSDLVSVLASRAREDWATRHAVPEGELGLENDDEFGRIVRLVGPDTRVADQDQWEMLKRVVPERIAKLDRQERVRDRLARVFQVLVSLAEAGEWSPPSQADLVRQLEIPRETVSSDFRLLREILSEILTGKSEE